LGHDVVAVADEVQDRRGVARVKQVEGFRMPV
jgi:hypothetical protein